MKVHLKNKQVCGDFIVGVLQPIYGQIAVPDIARLAEWQVLLYFATMCDARQLSRPEKAERHLVAAHYRASSEPLLHYFAS
ncbi:hypothetical protein FOMPIDRAFT_89017 [Fomitopsis schrenkii]|uniref:Uncharacterized protein n=1 Tax=Fomitopsis schrenkii TaxID=2126942 RepID=S8EGB9_FOMSC|nr:hypothetical protein FOMPIDRAFT_89017 [Fomitopsis schrenkii]